MTFKELKAAVKGRFMNWGKYTAEKLENVSAIFESTTTEDAGKVLTVGEDGSPEWGEGGGGSSLPPYTSADKGKVLTVGEGSESETVVVVPEQTVTTADMGGAYGGIIAGYEVTEFLNDVQQYENFVISVGSNSYPATYNGEGITSENNEYMVVGVPKTGVVFADMTATASASYSVSLSTVTPVAEPKWESNIIYQDLITEKINCSFNELKKRCKTSPIFLYSESGNSVSLYMLSNLNIEKSGGVSTYHAVFSGANSLGVSMMLTFASTDPDENMEINK